MLAALGGTFVRQLLFPSAREDEELAREARAGKSETKTETEKEEAQS